MIALKSLDGLGACATTATSSNERYATTKKITVSSNQLKTEGKQSVADLLLQTNYQFKPVENGYLVATEFGTRTLPSIVPFSEGSKLVASLKQPEAKPATQSTNTESDFTNTDKVKKAIGITALLAIVGLVLYPSPKKAMQGLPIIQI